MTDTDKLPEKSSLTRNLTFSTYFLSRRTLWFWAIILISIETIISVYYIPEKAFPLVFIRYALGFFYMIYLPGFSLVKALFPRRELENIERFALNIGMSLAIVPIVGLFLNYTPWGIRLTPIMVSLLIITIVLAIIGLLREYYALKL